MMEGGKKKGTFVQLVLAIKEWKTMHELSVYIYNILNSVNVVGILWFIIFLNTYIDINKKKSKYHQSSYGKTSSFLKFKRAFIWRALSFLNIIQVLS